MNRSIDPSSATAEARTRMRTSVRPGVRTIPAVLCVMVLLAARPLGEGHVLKSGERGQKICPLEDERDSPSAGGATGGRIQRGQGVAPPPHLSGIGSD